MAITYQKVGDCVEAPWLIVAGLRRVRRRSLTMESFEAVVIGSGVNGLVAAAELGLAGWKVALIEQHPQLGGFVASGELTLPGYVHDTFSSWHPQFTSGGAYAALGEKLHAHGLQYANTDGAVTGSTAVTGSAVVYRDAAKTAEGLASTHDRDAYMAMMDQMGARAGTVFGALGSEIRATKTMAKLGLGALRSQKLDGLEMLVRDAMMSGRSFMRGRFDGPQADQMWAPWLLHAGMSPDHATGGMMIPVLAMTLHGFGAPVVVGGAANFIKAFEGLFAELDVTVMTNRRAESIEVTDGVASGVVTDAGVVKASRAVIASVTPQALYGTLLKSALVPERIRTEAARYRYGRAAVQVHVALDRPLVWADDTVQDVPLVHISDGSGSTGIACAQADAGMLPAEPTIVVGRQELLDPARVPEGAGSLWLQLQEAPWAPTADAAGTIAVDGTWSESTKAAYIDRVLNRVEAHAPGTLSSILKVEALSPVDLAAANPNAVHGDPYSGSAELDQNLLWRPLPHAGGHATRVKGVWHIGASTHPGAGLNGGSGHLVAQALTSSRRKTGAKK